MGVSVDIYPKKSQFSENEPLTFIVEAKNNDANSFNITVVVKLLNLTEIIDEKKFLLNLYENEYCEKEISFSPEFSFSKGFGVDVDVFESGSKISEISSAADVTNNYMTSARYGFLSDFGPDENDDGDIKSLLKLHINLVQFYDWVYRHHDFIPKQNNYSDLMGKPHSLDVLKRKINLCHKSGMKAIAYGAVYACGKDYFKKNVDSGFYTSSKNPFEFINIFSIMNISRESPWHAHIIGEYEKAIKIMNFDGVHMDTYGFPKKAFSKIGDKTEEKQLEKLFPILIDDTKEELKIAKKDCCIIFNNVCNWPIKETAKANVDIVYIEVWKPYERYFHIEQLILSAKDYGGEKPVVLAAYLEPFRTSKDIEKAENAALFLTAIIAANGGFHLLCGEKNAVLTQGYYPDYSLLRESFIPKIRSYYDFLVRYEEILYDNSLSNVSMTHSGGDNKEYTFENGVFSPYAQPQSVFTVIRESKQRKAISFINFVGNSEDFWNKEKCDPIVQENIKINVNIEKQPKRVYTASPDYENCRPKMLSFNIEDTDRGKILHTNLKNLRFWALVVIDF